MAEDVEAEGRVTDAPASAPAALDGDDIVVVPGDAPRPGRRRWWLLTAGALVLLFGAFLGVVATRGDSSPAAVQLAPPVPTTLAATTTVPKAEAKVATKARQEPARPRTTTPVAPAPKPATGPPVTAQPAVAPPPPPPTTGAPTTTAPVPTSPPSVLEWTAPGTVTIKTGASVSVAIRALNPSRGVVSLPHPLSCAPKLDHSEVCAEVVQKIGPGQSASATYRIDAHGIDPGSYTISIEGLHTITVKVIA